MATRLARILRNAFVGKRTSLVSEHVHAAAKAVKQAEKAVRRLEAELGVGHASLAAVSAKCR